MPYNTEQDLNDYATARGITLNSLASVLLIKASDYIETRKYKGVKEVSGQANQWPRIAVYIDGELIDGSTVPNDIKYAELQTALAIDNGLDPLAPLKPAIKRKKTDVLETEYQDGAAMQATKLMAIDAFLKPYLKSSNLGYHR